MRLMGPDITILIGYGDYKVFLFSLDDFWKAKNEGLFDKTVYLDQKD